MRIVNDIRNFVLALQVLPYMAPARDGNRNLLCRLL